MYTWPTGCLTNTTVKENHWHICLEYKEKSAMVGHSIQLQDSSILFTKSR
jgi:hypothetical protein